MSKTFKKFFNFLLLVVFAVALAACTTLSDAEKQARDLARAQLDEALARITWAEPEEVTGNLYIAESTTKPVDEEYNGAIKSGLIYGVYAKFASSDTNVLDIKWVPIQKRVEVLDTEGNVVGLDYQGTYELRGIVNRPEVGQKAADVTMTITGNIDYTFTDNGQTKTKTITLVKEIVFTVLPKVPTSDVTIAEIESVANADYTAFNTNGMVDSDGNKNIAVTVKGYVSHILHGSGNGSFVLTDEDGYSMYVYNSGNKDIQVGNYVSVNGVPAGYYDSVQIGAGATVTILDDSRDTDFDFVDTSIDEWHDQKDMKVDHSLGGTLISIRGVLVLESGAYRVVSENDSKNYFLIYASSYSANGYEKTLLNSYLNKVVIVKGAVYDYHSSGYWRLITNCFEYPIQEVTLSEAEKFAADKATLPTTLELNAGDTFTLPAGTLTNGSVLSAWTADVDGVLDLTNFKALDVTDPTVVTLSATLTNGSLSEVVTITVTVNPRIDKISIADFLLKEVNTTDYYKISGVITKWYTSGSPEINGRYYINDGTGEVLIYGTSEFKGAAVSTFGNLGIGIGDSVTVCGVRGAFSGTPQMNSGFHVDSAKATDIATFKTLTTADKKFYALTGVVTEIQNTTYGNVIIEDENGETVLVYGILEYKGGPNKVFGNLNVKVGNTITVAGQYGEHSGTPQVVNAYLIANTEPVTEETLLALDIATINTAMNVTVGNTLTLPEGPLPNGSTIGEWTPNIAGMFDGEMKALPVSVDTEVEFTATVTNGAATADVTIVVTIKPASAPGTYELVRTVDFGTTAVSGFAANKIIPAFADIVFHWTQTAITGTTATVEGAFAVICPVRTGNADGDAGLYFTSTELITKIEFDMTWWTISDKNNNGSRINGITIDYKDGDNWVTAGTIDAASLDATALTTFDFTGFSANEVRINVFTNNPVGAGSNVNARIVVDNVKLYK